MAEIVYILCAVTSLWCAVLLLRGYWRTGARLLLWSALCFIGLTGNNLMLYADMIMFPDADLSIWRGLSAVLGISFLLYGMIWDSE